MNLSEIEFRFCSRTEEQSVERKERGPSLVEMYPVLTRNVRTHGMKFTEKICIPFVVYHRLVL